MKYLLTLLFAAATCIHAYGQDITIDNSQNGVRMIMTDAEEYNIGGSLLGNSPIGKINLRLGRFISQGRSNYLLVVSYTTINKVVNFPYHAKIQLTTKNGSEVELECMECGVENGSPTAFFPISEEKLQRLFEGTKVVNFEFFTINKKGVVEKGFHRMKSNIGKKLKKMHDVIAEQAAS